MYRIRLTASPRPCWFAEWLDPHDTIAGVNYNEAKAATFSTRSSAERVAAMVSSYWLPVVEEG